MYVVVMIRPHKECYCLTCQTSFSGDDSNSRNSEEEYSVLFEKRQAGKFGTRSVSVKIGIREGVVGKHIDDR